MKISITSGYFTSRRTLILSLPVLFSALMQLWSCKSSQVPSTSIWEQLKEPYIYNYKITYFQKLLMEGFDNSPEINAVLSRDKSRGYGEPLLTLEDYAYMDSLIKLDNERMIADSVAKVGRVSEGYQGKHILSFALSRFNSKWLDSLARERYKISPMKASYVDDEEQ